MCIYLLKLSSSPQQSNTIRFLDICKVTNNDYEYILSMWDWILFI